MLDTTDFFQEQIKQCKTFAAQSTNKNERNFWRLMARSLGRAVASPTANDWWCRKVRKNQIRPPDIWKATARCLARLHDAVISLGVCMADYYSVISRAVAALEVNTFDDRRAIYNRARAMQSYRLGKRPYNKADFGRERLMLEDAISRVETEATTKRITTEASSSAPVQPNDIAPTPMAPLPSVGSWLKSVLRRLWRD
jgi:hypothetical protein